MKRFTTPLKGITTNSIYEDGDMYSLVNLRKKGGYLHPVSPGEIVGHVCGDYNLHFVHRNEDWEHWIGVVNGSTSSVYWNINDCDNLSLISSNITGEVNSIEQNGNMLVFITNDTQYYALFKNGNYVWYGEMPDLVPLQWNCYEEVSYYEGGNLGKELNIDTLPIIAESRFATYDNSVDYGYIFNIPISEENINSLRNAIKSALNETRIKLSRDYSGDSTIGVNKLFGGLFYDAFFIRYAYRLYDNTNVKLSPPILVMPYNELNKTATVISYWNFTPKIANNQVGFGFHAGLSRMQVTGYVPGIKYDLSSLSSYDGLIKGIDVFVSPYIPREGDIGDINKLFPFVFPGDLDDVSIPYGDSVSESILSDIDMKSVSEMSSFYLVKSYDIGASSGGTYEKFIDITDDESINNINNLVQKEQLIDSNASIHTIGAKKSYTYNKRLHLIGGKTTYFKGFDCRFFTWGKASIPVNANLTYYNGTPVFTYSDIGFQTDDDCIIEVYIERGSSSGYVYTSFKVTDEDNPTVFSAMISYPDINAKKMTVYRKDNLGKYYRVKEFNLTEHSFLNIAYYLNEGLLAIKNTGGTLLSDAIDTTKVFSYEMNNELLVYDTENQLRLSNENIISVGSGKILNIGSNVMNVSNWNYGTYPLYVFTDEGVYTLKVGEGNVAYSAVLQPTYMEPPISDVICSIPQGVIFIISRGLCVINGLNVTFVSQSIEEYPIDINISAYPEMDVVLPNYGKTSFMEYIRGATEMIYNSNKNEVVIVNGSMPYNWVMTLDDMSFYLSTHHIGDVVKNSIPKLYSVYNRDVIDLSIETGDTHVSFITRPVTFGTKDIKLSERHILRSVLYGLNMGAINKHPIISLCHSNDGRNFVVSRGMLVKGGNFKDIDTGLYSKVKFREFILCFGGVCGQQSVFEMIDSVIDKEYDNTKIR